MSVKYFPKPQPLSPSTRTWVDSEGVRWEKGARVRGGKRRVKGAWCTDSIYYLWFEYLKRSSKYKSACANNGKGMQKLYKDFGDVYAYEGIEGFWKWWTDIGQYLFSSKPISNVSGFFTLGDVAEYEAEVKSEKILLLPIPTQANKVSVTKAVSKLLKEVRFTEGNNDKPKYEIENVKVDVKGLAKALLAYDMKQKGKDILEIGLTVRGFDKKEFVDWMADGRRQHREYSIDEWADWCDNNREEYERILSSAKITVKNRLKEGSTSTPTIDYDDMVDLEMRRQKTDFVRTSMKKSIRTYTYKLLNKAEANIEAVGKGTFGVGIYPNKSKNPAAKNNSVG